MIRILLPDGAYTEKPFIYIDENILLIANTITGKVRKCKKSELVKFEKLYGNKKNIHRKIKGTISY